MNRFNRYLLGTYVQNSEKEQLDDIQVDGPIDENIELLNNLLAELITQNREYFEVIGLPINHNFKIWFVKNKYKSNKSDYSSNSLISLCNGQKELASTVAEYLLFNIDKIQSRIENLESIEASKFGHV